jgi:hypothetical protein
VAMTTSVRAVRCSIPGRDSLSLSKCVYTVFEAPIFLVSGYCGRFPRCYIRPLSIWVGDLRASGFKPPMLPKAPLGALGVSNLSTEFVSLNVCCFM